MYQITHISTHIHVRILQHHHITLIRYAFPDLQTFLVSRCEDFTENNSLTKHHWQKRFLPENTITVVHATLKIQFSYLLLSLTKNYSILSLLTNQGK